jgi:hypothetical protein
MKKNCFTKINKKPPCILLMNSHLILSLKPTCSTPFLKNLVEGFIRSYGKV